jgi:non-ribosomal peptide synthetase component F
VLKQRTGKPKWLRRKRSYQLNLATVRFASLQDETLGQRYAYWKKTLLDFPVQQLPTDHPRSGIVTNRDDRNSELPLLDDAERDKLLYEWNDTARDYPTETCLHELIEAQVKRTPDAVALIFENEALTYRELNGRANQLAHCLRKVGVGPDTVVGVFAERSVEMVAGLLATIKAGGAYLPIDPNWPFERLAFILGEAKPCAVLVQRHLVERLPRNLREIVVLNENLASESDVDLTSGAHTCYARPSA